MALSLIAVILGIFYTIRKLDARSRTQADFPWVPPAEFSVWQEREVRVYGRAALACVLKLVIGIWAEYWLLPNYPRPETRYFGAAVDFSWFAVVVWTALLGRSLSKERRRLGIVLGTPHQEIEAESDQEEK